MSFQLPQPTYYELQTPSAVSDSQKDTPEDPNQVAAALQQPQQTPMFRQIIDVINEYQRGNYLPVFHCLRYNLIPKDYIDYTGYNVLHVAVSQGSIPIVLILLDHFKIDVNIRSASQQTALMIACNYGMHEIIRILCERGAFINEQDNTKFSALLYSVKAGRIPQLAYLLHQKADLQVRDTNGCTPQHWAAYKNDVFMLKILKKLGLDLEVVDHTGLTPLERATQSEAPHATKFLLENCNKMPANLKLETVQNQDIKEMVRRKFLPTRWENFQDTCKSLLSKNSQLATFGIYAILWTIMMTMYMHIIMNKGFGYTFDLVFLLLGLYFIVYAFWYYTKSGEHLSKAKATAYERLNKSAGLIEELQPVSPTRFNPRQRLNYDALDKLLRGEDTGSVIQEIEPSDFSSFLHELAFNFETKNYKELARFDQKDYCASCLIKRPARSTHHEAAKTCVSNLHHYSYCLGKSVDQKNHFLYLVMLIKQMLVLGLFIVGVWVTYAEKITNTKVWFAETAYRVGEDYGITYGGMYAVFLVLAAYNLVFLWIEVYGVMKNVTYHELFNRNDYSNMFAIKLDHKKAYVKRYINPYDLGAMENLKQYVQRILH